MALPRRCQASRVFVQGEEEICIGDVATLELRMGFLVSIPGNLCQTYRKNHCFLIGKSSTLHMGHVKHGYEINDQCVIGMMPFVSEFGGEPQESKVIPMVNHHRIISHIRIPITVYEDEYKFSHHIMDSSDS